MRLKRLVREFDGQALWGLPFFGMDFMDGMDGDGRVDLMDGEEKGGWLCVG